LPSLATTAETSCSLSINRRGQQPWASKSPALKDLTTSTKPGDRRRVVKDVFEDAYNYMKSGQLMRQVVNKINEGHLEKWRLPSNHANLICDFTICGLGDDGTTGLF
jgi:hypothetical protein